MIAADWIGYRARTTPERLALRDAEGRELRYGQLHERALTLAAELADEPGTRVIEIEPGTEHAVAVAASLVSGAPFQSLRPGLPGPERDAALRGLDAPVIIGKGSTATGAVRGSADATSRDAADGILCRVLTSGTSGARKPVELTRANWFASAAASAFNLGVREEDRWLCCLPVDHVGGLGVILRSLIYGTAAVVHPGFDVDRVKAALCEDVTLVSLVPTQLGRLLDAGARLELPRAILLGGGPAPEAMLEAALERGATVVQTYGLTEACSQVCTLSPVDAVRGRGSTGRPLPGIDVIVEDGEIVVGGPTVAPGVADADGFLRTGDRGRFDAAGFLRVEGRVDDLIVTGGENVAPEEVESVLRAHPGVADAAVVGRPDPEWGNAVVAIVVPAAGREPPGEDLVAHCRERLARHKVPKLVELASELPRSATGKLLRRRLG